MQWLKDRQQFKTSRETLKDTKSATKTAPETTGGKDKEISSQGYRPQPGERSMTREQWKAKHRARRVANNPPKIDVGHIFHGEINANGKPVGFHHRGSIGHTGRARIVVGTESVPNAQGVYTAKVQVFKPSAGNWVTKKSTFFPDSWSRLQVINEIRSAFINAHLIRGRLWEGISPSGVRIQGYFEGNTIKTAYPIY
jgi:hypothetical protein